MLIEVLLCTGRSPRHMAVQAGVSECTRRGRPFRGHAVQRRQSDAIFMSHGFPHLTVAALDLVGAQCHNPARSAQHFVLGVRAVVQCHAEVPG